MINIPEFKDAERVFYYFEEISKIPHGSYNTKPIADYLENFAKSHSFEYVRDEADNLVIKKAATPGYEDRPSVILQGHTDMVAEKSADSVKDMENEGIEIYRDGDFLRAVGTTLGGDDGVAVAYMLALLEANDIPHPAIEALFTSDEEVGLIGAAALDTKALEGKIMINIDSDDEGIFTVGCAGGARVDIEFSVSRETISEKKYLLTVSDLMGGHSGVEIDKNRASAIKLASEVLSNISGARLISLDGGTKDNAIPRDCSVEFISNNNITSLFEEAKRSVLSKYIESEPYAKITLTELDETEAYALDESSSNKVISMLCEVRFGVIAMSEDIAGLVESSENLGIAHLTEEKMEFTVSVRSSKSEEKAKLISVLRDLAQKNGASVSVRGEYPAWEYKRDSHIRDVACRVFFEMYGKEAKVITIHAGLECGIFSDKIEGLDCISLGPDNYDIHTTEEHLSISSTARVWDFLKKVLCEI